MTHAAEDDSRTVDERLADAIESEDPDGFLGVLLELWSDATTYIGAVVVGSAQAVNQLAVDVVASLASRLADIRESGIKVGAWLIAEAAARARTFSDERQVLAARSGNVVGLPNRRLLNTRNALALPVDDLVLLFLTHYLGLSVDEILITHGYPGTREELQAAIDNARRNIWEWECGDQRSGRDSGKSG